MDADGKVIGTQEVRDDAPARALAFKVINDQFGTLTFVRIYSGVIKKGDTLANVTRGKKERIGRIVEVQASATKDIEEGRAGDICAFVSMKETETGDSLSDPDHPALLERMRFPDPVISVAVEPKSRADVDKMSTALYKMVKADPSLRLQVDQETGQTVLTRHGRAAPRGHDRPHAHRARRRGQHGPAARQLPRGVRQFRSSTSTRTRSRRAARVSSPK